MKTPVTKPNGAA